MAKKKIEENLDLSREKAGKDLMKKIILFVEQEAATRGIALTALQSALVFLSMEYGITPEILKKIHKDVESMYEEEYPIHVAERNKFGKV